MSKITINTLRSYKSNSIFTVACTAYSYWESVLTEKAEIDWVLVGDSAANVEHGHKTTINISLDEMLSHMRAVSRGNNYSFLVGDFPFGTYEKSDLQAVETAQAFIKNGAHCVKLERCFPSQIKAISNSGILVFAHLGLTPQSTMSFGGYKVQGKTKKSTEIILEQAKIVEEAGASLLLLEAMPPESGDYIAKNLKIPVYSIGAGPCDGQLLIFHDLLSLFLDFKPKFAKQYLYGAELIIAKLKEYKEEVRSGIFPSEEYSYKGQV